MTNLVFASPPIQVVAGENMYGDIASQLGGKRVQVRVILNNPDQDPHLFELTPSIGKMVKQADLVIANGLGYDAWLGRLLNKSQLKSEQIISIQTLLSKKDGENPHLWYDLQAIDILSKRLEQAYIQLRPDQKAFFSQKLDQLKTEISSIDKRIKKIRDHYTQVKVAATEPVFGLMAKALGFEILEEPYQWTVMNGGEPTPKQVAQFQNDLKTHKIQVLFYNDQVVTPATEQLKKIAQQSSVPVVGISETMPTDLNYQQWINQTLDKVENALKSMPK
ncbi:metal ABC transporter solute-binding protein, Zn/Mn family [Commensalibacter oyaizuii]|uniref:Zinc ABC transporter substrate-binding protein n=1 Tax=Commensalibacter oyaizuii TaxID=3043873 RepID=A0ABT6Q3N0_9PROT|nr:zinc ABC transporter substrate-binding protein [Commensalibacter sp. TBRC 16381]MDI2091181.1 zinc ABC transporter substrate-binding protein [Commensalibacter sp. TBRC 16381]